MARFSAALTQGLMNPTYSAQLGQAAGMLGGLGGNLIAEKNKAARMEELRNAPDARTRMEMAVKTAKTPAEIMAAQQALTNFDRTAQADTRADTLFQQGQEKVGREAAQEQGRAILSNLGMGYNKAIAAGAPEKAEEILKKMATVGEKTGLEVQDFVSSEVPERYKPVGKYVFDKTSGTFLDPESGKAESTDAMDENDFAQRLYQNKEAYTEDSWAAYSASVTEEGVRKAAEKLEAINPEEAISKKRMAMTSESNRLLSQADELLARVPKDALGRTGQFVLGALPMTEQGAVQGLVDTLKSNIAFDTLQQMRDMSKTGGALGQVSNNELKLLESNIAALDPSSPDFPKRLQQVMDQYQHIQNIMQGPEGSDYFDVDEEGKQVYLNPVDNRMYYVKTGIIKKEDS
jgi:hypothetical protein